MAKLTFALEDGQEVIVPLTERITLGRDEDNDVVVNDDQLALQHAEILPHSSGGYEVRDLGSTTGTFVNGARVESCRLIQGDRLAFGPLTAVLDLEVPDHSPAEHNEALRAEAAAAMEERLTHWQAAAREAEAAHQQWLTAIADLTGQHGEKNAALQRLGTDIITAQEKLSDLTTQRQEATQKLEKIQSETTQAQTRLSELRQQITDLELDFQQGQSRLTGQKAEFKTAEESLAQTQARLQDAETRHGTLAAAIANLVQDQQQRESRLNQLVIELKSTEIQLTTRRRELADETRHLEETKRRRSELEKQGPPAAPQRHAEPTRLPAQPAAAPSPAPRIVAIDSPRLTVIPMKSERVVKRTGDTPPRKET
jgi:pSer/pThr/pTyr-binding forkhead associated (FHA) protein